MVRVLLTKPGEVSVAMAPTTQYEDQLCRAGYGNIAGIDEAGRGCWAGPVVAAAVVLPREVLTQPMCLADVDDSKRLNAHQRETMYAQIYALATGIGLGIVPAYLIDTMGIVPATRLAMMIALLSLPCQVDALLIDALTLPGLSLWQRSLIKGDASCLSIAAASIVAKVSRDHLLCTADSAYPGYGFALHKGYGTVAHQRALRRLGPCAFHRWTFRPVTALCYPELEAQE